MMFPGNVLRKDSPNFTQNHRLRVTSIRAGRQTRQAARGKSGQKLQKPTHIKSRMGGGRKCQTTARQRSRETEKAMISVGVDCRGVKAEAPVGSRARRKIRLARGAKVHTEKPFRRLRFRKAEGIPALTKRGRSGGSHSQGKWLRTLEARIERRSRADTRKRDEDSRKSGRSNEHAKCQHFTRGRPEKARRFQKTHKKDRVRGSGGTADDGGIKWSVGQWQGIVSAKTGPTRAGRGRDNKGWKSVLPVEYPVENRTLRMARSEQYDG